MPQEGRFALNRVPFRRSTWRMDVLVYNYTPIVATVVFVITQKQYVASLDHYPEYYVAADPVPGSALRKLQDLTRHLAPRRAFIRDRGRCLH